MTSTEKIQRLLDIRKTLLLEGRISQDDPRYDLMRALRNIQYLAQRGDKAEAHFSLERQLELWEAVYARTRSTYVR